MQFVNGILFGCGLGLGFYLGVSAWNMANEWFYNRREK